MKRIRMIHGMAALALLLMSALPATAAPAAYQLVNYTIDGGGHVYSNGGRFQLSGAIGQPDSTTVQTAGQRTLVGGFWGPVQRLNTPVDVPGVGETKLFLPLVNR
jgi:hypothetical protein